MHWPTWVAFCVPVATVAACDVRRYDDSTGLTLKISCAGEVVSDGYLQTAFGNSTEAIGLSVDMSYSLVNNVNQLSELVVMSQKMSKLSALSLDFSHCTVDSKDSQTSWGFDMKALWEALRNLRNLSRLAVTMRGSRSQWSCIRPSWFLDSLAPGLRTLRSLTAFSLDMTGAGLNPSDIEMLGAGLGPTTNLSSLALTLSSNNVGDEGAWALSEAMRRLKELNSFALEAIDSRLANLGAQRLGASCASLGRLMSLKLDLGYNEIEAAGACDMVKHFGMLKEVTTLKINMKLNKLGITGDRCIIAGFQDLSNIHDLSMDLSYTADRRSPSLNDADAVFEQFGNFSKLDSLSVDVSGVGIVSADALRLVSRISKLNSSTMQFRGMKIDSEAFYEEQFVEDHVDILQRLGIFEVLQTTSTVVATTTITATTSTTTTTTATTTTATTTTDLTSTTSVVSTSTTFFAPFRAPASATDGVETEATHDTMASPGRLIDEVVEVSSTASSEVDLETGGGSEARQNMNSLEPLTEEGVQAFENTTTLEPLEFSIGNVSSSAPVRGNDSINMSNASGFVITDATRLRGQRPTTHPFNDGSSDVAVAAIVVAMVAGLGFFVCSRQRSSTARTFDGGVHVRSWDDHEQESADNASPCTNPRTANSSSLHISGPRRSPGPKNERSRVSSTEDARHAPVPASAVEPDADDEDWQDFASAPVPESPEVRRQMTLESMLEAQINEL